VTSRRLPFSDDLDSSTNKSNGHDIIQMLLKVTLKICSHIPIN
jgi:hypothetical protein